MSIHRNIIHTLTTGIRIFIPPQRESAARLHTHEKKKRARRIMEKNKKPHREQRSID